MVSRIDWILIIFCIACNLSVNMEVSASLGSEGQSRFFVLWRSRIKVSNGVRKRTIRAGGLGLFFELLLDVTTSWLRLKYCRLVYPNNSWRIFNVIHFYKKFMSFPLLISLGGPLCIYGHRLDIRQAWAILVVTHDHWYFSLLVWRFLVVLNRDGLLCGLISHIRRLRCRWIFTVI